MRNYLVPVAFIHFFILSCFANLSEKNAKFFGEAIKGLKVTLLDDFVQKQKLFRTNLLINFLFDKMLPFARNFTLS